MANWELPILITGPVVFDGLGESSMVTVAIALSDGYSSRKAGGLRVEVPINGKFATVSYQSIRFGVSLIFIPVPTYRLSFDPVGSLTTIDPNATISIYQLSPTEVRNLRMSGSHDPSPRPVGFDSAATVNASAINTVLAIANENRTPEGYIVNNANKNLWVTFTGTPATTAPPATKILPNGGNYDIPGNYTGIIYGIWEPGAVGSCVVHEFSFIDGASAGGGDPGSDA